MIKVPIETNGEPATARLLPPASDACQICGHRPAHAPDAPHNAQSLYYQYAFYAAHLRWPTWKDAIAHCDEPTRKIWERELRAKDAWSEP